MTTHATQPLPAHQLRHPGPTKVGEGHFTTDTTSIQQLPIPRGVVEAELIYFQDPEDGSAPFNYVEPQPEGQIQRNYGAFHTQVEINDIRGNESKYTLDGNAFAALSDVQSEVTYEEWSSDDAVKDKYYPEVTQLLQNQLPDSHKVIIFDHTIRRALPGSSREPVLRVHIDQTPEAVRERVRLHASSPEEAEQLLAGRYRLINVWRPLNGPLYAHPLAVADSSTVRDEELVPVEHRYPNRTGYTAGVRYHPDQKWYYLSGMTNDERLLLECYDSHATNGGRVPHTAFKDPRTPEGAPSRESIEVRTLVFG